MQHSIVGTQVVKFITLGIESREAGGRGRWEREVQRSWGLGFYLLLTVVNEGVECSLLGVGIAWKQEFSSFFLYFARDFQPTSSAILGLSGWI